MEITKEEELDYIVHELADKKASLQAVKRLHDERKAEVAVLEEAMLDYMKAHGVVETEHDIYVVRRKIGSTIVVDDVDALPEEYVRVKREANRDKIRKERPSANWYRESETEKLEMKICK